MTVSVIDMNPIEIGRFIYSQEHVNLSDKDKQTFDRCLSESHIIRAGFVNNNVVCCWGLIPPTIISDTAYLWLYCTDKLKDNKFLFIRRSQIEIKKMLSQYCYIIGHVAVGNDLAINWLKWLGASISVHSSNGYYDFTMEAKHG